MKKLFTCYYGSRLYGTQTPTSDLDVKHVVLLALGDLLIGKPVKNIVHKTNNERSVRNTMDDVDEEFIPLQVFARDFLAGQTYALEMAFVLEGLHAGQQFYSDEGQVVPHSNHLALAIFVNELKKHYLTSNIKAMMGYVVNQANLYSFKGERLNVAREFRQCLMKGWFDSECGDDPISDFTMSHDFVPVFAALEAKYPKYFKVAEYDIGGGRMKPCFTLLEKTFPFTNTLSHSLTVVDALINKYGTRADQASAANVDWKAMMHALRIVDEGLELLSTRQLTFPFEQARVDRYLSIKRGEVPIEEVRDELAAKLDRLKELEQTTTLPTGDQVLKAEFEEWLSAWMYIFYHISITKE